MRGWSTFLCCACLATALVGCGKQSGAATTLIPPLPTRGNSAQPTPPAMVTSAPQMVSTSGPLHSMVPLIPTASQPNPTLPATTAPLPPASKGDNGIEGQTLIGPTCPVVHIDNPCPDRPYQATIVVLNQNRAQVKRFDTDAEGRFRVELPPGTYTLVPQAPGKLPRAGELTIQVTRDQFTPVTITYDSGIR